MPSFNHNSGQHFHVAGANIYYETAGDKNKPVMLLLHGGFGNIEDFNDLLPALAGKFYLIGVDSRGQGKSTLGNEKLTYERIQLDLEALIPFLKIDKLSILGFSDGASADKPRTGF
jgi:pimeloyl-ACP methyl ester carboxylesterase